MLAGREGGAPRPGEDVLQVADHAGVPFRQFLRDLVARRHEILQGFTDGRVGGLVGEFPSSIEESGGRGGREACWSACRSPSRRRALTYCGTKPTKKATMTAMAMNNLSFTASSSSR